MNGVLLKLAIWKDVEEYLGKRQDLVIPLGSCEQHGPSGPLGCDLIVAEELANELGEDVRALVTPAWPVGCSSLHGAFPGTLALRPMTLMAVVRDLLSGLHRQGFRRFLFVNAHPGSSGVYRAAIAQSHEDLPEARVLLFDWWECGEVKAVLAELFGAREGQHATPGELSLVRKFYPRGVLDLASGERFEPFLPHPTWSAKDFRARHPDGRVGSDPSLASGTAGDRLFVVALRALAEAHRRLVEEA